MEPERPRKIAVWFEKTVLEMGLHFRWSFLPPLMVYFAAGISGLTAIVGAFFVKEYLGLSAAFLAGLTFWVGLPWALKMPIGHLVDIIWRWKSLLVYFGASLIAASLLMEQVLAPRMNFTPKNAGPMTDFDYGEGGYREGETNAGFNEKTGQLHLEIKGLAEPNSEEATRICEEDINEVITAFVQDKAALERGVQQIADGEVVPEELTVVRMGKIVKDRYPDLSEQDQEAVRQRAVAAMNLTNKAKAMASGDPDAIEKANTGLIEGVRRLSMDVRDMDIDLIESINPFQSAYAVLASPMNEATLKQVEAVIAGRKVQFTTEEARELTRRALQFKEERGRVPEINAQDAWERRMAEGMAFLARKVAEQRDE